VSIPDPTIGPIVADLVAYLQTTMADVPNPPTDQPRTVCLRPGDRVDLLISQAVDECCSGLSWVRWVGMHPSAVQFPVQDIRVTPCDVRRWAVVVELGAVRCAPVTEVETIPTCDQWTDTALNVYDDLAAIRRALCAYTADHPGALVLQGAAAPLQVDGGCVGAAMLATISAPACDCPEGTS
jgi:hypothetical protein